MSISNYAKALFEIAKEEKKIDLLTFHFEDFMHSIKKHPEWITLMDSPMIAFSDKVVKINDLEYDLSFLAFLKMLAQKSKLHYVYDIFPEWVDLSRVHQKIAHLHIYSAIPITDVLEKRLREAIQPRFKHQTLDFHITIDPSLLGGLKIVYQGQSLDHSVQRELQELYTTI